MKVAYAALWAILASLTWSETYLLWKARRYDPTSVVLNQQSWASFCRATALSLGGLLGFNRILGGLIPERFVRLLLSLALGINAVPSIRFLYLYRSHRLK